MTARTYTEPRDGDWRRFKVWFTDERGREFHREVWAYSTEEAVFRAVKDDRLAGGSAHISFKKVDDLCQQKPNH